MPSKTNTPKKSLAKEESSVGKSLEEKSMEAKSMGKKSMEEEDRWRELTILEKGRLGTWR